MHSDLRIAPQSDSERRFQASVHLERMHVLGHSGQRTGEDPEAGADLQDHIVGATFQVAEDDPQDIVVDKEVLAQVPFRGDAELGQTGQRDLAQTGRRRRAARVAGFAGVASCAGVAGSP